MPRERRPFKRPNAFRDAKLFIIATEGAQTEPEYFNALRSAVRSPRIHVEILKREEPGESSPAAVQRMLHGFEREYSIDDKDELWLIMDCDRWPHRVFNKVCRESSGRGWHLGVSNPCFEIWLLLHFEEIHALPEAEKEILRANGGGLLKARVGPYMQRDKHTIYLDHIRSRMELAIERALRLDSHPKELWPSRIGTRVYRLVAAIKQLGNVD